LSDFVLIHSTGQSAAGWDRVVRALEQRGAAAHAVDLPTDRPELRASEYAEIIRGDVGDLGRPVVVAHSGSGILLPAAATVLNASHQVWLAAWVPNPDASFREEVADHVKEAFDPGWVGQDPTVDAEVAKEFVFHDCDELTLAWALTTRSLFLPTAVYDERVSLNRQIPSTYVLATADRTIRPEWQRRMARERLEVEPVEIDSGHCPNVSRPDELAEILLALRQEA